MDLKDALKAVAWRKSSYSDGDGGNCVEASDSLTSASWRKSTYSGGSGGDCVEASDSLTSASWRKSTYSGGDGGDCVEVADNLTGIVPVRDSKDPSGPALTFSPAAWTAFVAATARGEFPTA
jgi:Domain of unknown function (DUF397)